MRDKSGLTRCEEAFDRLKDGQPHLSNHVGIKPGDITPALVSIEAGFDKGYLKRSRESHAPLIARIDALKSVSSSSASASKEKLERATRLAEKRQEEVEQLKLVLDQVLTQNLMLVERVKELEKDLSKYQAVMKF